MSLIEKAGLAILHQLNPETAHGLSLRALKAGLVPTRGAITGPRLKTKLAGLQLPNPIGLAAGYDKNAEALPALMNAGFGFIEVGAATPRAQAGNDKPRLFRLPEDAAVINRFGFNNDGMVAIGTRLARRPAGIPVGLNLGANKDSADRAADFAQVLSACGPDCDFATVNVSSPNTEALRDLQGKAALAALLELVMDTNAGLPKPIPIFLKIAPDLSRREVDDIAEVALAAQVAGLVATNTTLARDGLINARRSEKGGLSGQPLFESSTRVLAQLHAATDGALPLIGVGGVASGAQAYQKIRAGATAVQLYTGLVYGGLSLLDRIASELDACLHRAGFASVSAAVGTGVDEWLTD